jgi:predicted mannosyl-3-phosphoglycerate phosphatase (HAD superfamily)
MLRRTQTIYVEVDPFFSPRGKVLHRFDQFLEELAQAQLPCVWISGLTRAQLDEPRRHLGQNDPYIGENGCAVYLPEDYFHLKGGETIRLGRYTCIPVAKPQPAAAEALEELSSDTDVAVVPLRKLSQRELSQNTGLPAKEAELMRQRDFDELFFFAGAGEADIERLRAEAKARGLVLRKAGQFCSLACGSDLAKCVRELGGLYDRALRAHALRVGLRVLPGDGGPATPDDNWPSSVFDRTLALTERGMPAGRAEDVTEENSNGAVRFSQSFRANQSKNPSSTSGQEDRNRLHLHSPEVWDEVSAWLGSGSTRR